MEPLAAAAAAVRLAGSAPAAQEHGAGPLLRILLVVAILGAVLLAWFLLRGYRSDAPAQNAAGDRAAAPRGGAGTASAEATAAERPRTTPESG